ncbi:hypothetical protein KUL152_34380 [Tenacibaculum sp. KUL152]|nr:hypothetical protein KUL152_34380 [Tenacibaculum sp. KUL152]
MNKVFIHIGPPKSGTSAIQKWLSDNRDYLASKGVFYPEHELDENGVSSGNLLSLFSQDGEDFLLDEAKVSSLLEEFISSKNDVLILSSEFFFKRMEQLAQAIPEAMFIGYLRFPLEVAESSYNQGVKRHGQVHAFGLPATPRAYQLEILDRLIKKIGRERFILRPYSKQCFKNGNLIEDFLDKVGVEPINLNTPLVNTSYTLEGLEFKRWFNQLTLDSLQYDMDLYLQREKNGTTSYSLIPPATFEKFKLAFVEQIDMFCNEHTVEQREVFVELCKDLKQKSKYKQIIDNVEFERIFKGFIYQPGVLKKVVAAYESQWRYQPIPKSPERMEIVKQNLPLKERMAYKLRMFANRFR